MDMYSWPEAGPSRPCAHQPPSHDQEDVVKWSRHRRDRRLASLKFPQPSIPPSSPPLTPRRRRPPRKPGLVIPLLLPLLPLASAAPPPIVLSKPDSDVRPRRVQPVYNFRRETRQSELPDGLPTDVQVVEENSLPYILERDADGVWSKSNQGWKLYGRASGSISNVDAVTNDTSEFAVEQTLPKGWGSTTNRTSAYKVPLIAAASLILALAIVAAIIILALHRRKAHRRAKRRAERARRKALNAAGFTDDQNSSVYDSVLRAHLEEIDAQYGIKKRKKKQSSLVKTKVKRWRQGLRKRKENGENDGDQPDQPTIYEEPKTMDNDLGLGVLRSSRHSLSTISLTSTPPSDERTTLQDSPTTQETPDSHHTRDDPSSPLDDNDPDVPEAPPAFFGLPAYRPASVRSYNMHDAPGPSRPAGPSRARSSPEYDDEDDRLVHGRDKVTAPGYYPAPATEESEAALAVAQRSDGKSGLPRPPSPAPSDEPRHAHLATDDKQVLERMRLGGSAPSAPPTEMEQGPSAPHVDVDDEGFERLHLEAEIPRSSHRMDHLPEPPRRNETRSYASDEPTSLQSLPSAPPVSEDPGEYSGPSAPPMLDPEEIPSAPPEDPEAEDRQIDTPNALPTHSRPASIHGDQLSDSDLYS